MRVIADPNIPRGQFFMIAAEDREPRWWTPEKSATIGTAMEPMDPLDRKLADLTERIARLERRDVQSSADLSAALGLLARALVAFGRMMKGEDGVHN